MGHPALRGGAGSGAAVSERVLGVAAGAAEPRHLFRGRRLPDGAHRHRPRVAMSQGATRRFSIRYSIQRWNDGVWFYGSFFVILVVLIVAKLIQHQSILSFLPVLVLDGGILLDFWLMRLFSYVEVADG